MFLYKDTIIKNHHKESVPVFPASTWSDPLPFPTTHPDWVLSWHGHGYNLSAQAVPNIAQSDHGAGPGLSQDTLLLVIVNRAKKSWKFHFLLVKYAKHLHT